MLQRYLLIILLIALFPDSSQAQAPSQDTLGVVMHADPRLAVLFVKKRESGYKGIRGSIRSARGFRVQIYSGNDRGIATQRKIDFIHRFPNVRTYMSYIPPTFRVKVGDFKTRAEAYKFYSQVSSLYTPCMVVPDIVEINTLRDDD
jgi:hypothetical protein